MRKSQASTPFIPEATRCRRFEWRLGALRQTTGGQGGQGGTQDWPVKLHMFKGSVRTADGMYTKHAVRNGQAASSEALLRHLTMPHVGRIVRES